MNIMPSLAVVAAASSYEATRFNALRHGVLSRYTVLPWEDESEYQTLIGALVTEHAPEGPTEEHLVEELAGIIWRKRRLRMAEAAVYCEKLRHDVTNYGGPEHIAGAALLPITGVTTSNADVGRALAGTATQAGRELRELKRDRAMSRRAWDTLVVGGPSAYEAALAALRDDTRAGWRECLAEPPDDGLTYEPTAEALKAWIKYRWREWYEQPFTELENRDLIRDQALGAAYSANDLDAPMRYEAHLDRKLERTLAMLVRLRDFRRGVTPA